MLVVTGTMEVPGESVPAMQEAAAAMARATRQEDGCIAYAFWQDVERPTVFRVYEEWRDGDCLKAHGDTAHMAEYRRVLKSIGMFGRDIRMFEPGPATQL